MTQNIDWCHKFSYNIVRWHIKLIYCICNPHLILCVRWKNKFSSSTYSENEFKVDGKKSCLHNSYKLAIIGIKVLQRTSRLSYLFGVTVYLVPNLA